MLTNKKFETIHEYVEDTCKCVPNQIALDFGNRITNFETLQIISCKVADLLSSDCNSSEGNLVAIMMDPSDLQVMALLGILKANCIFVPIDPTFPEKRVAYILNNSKAKTCITDRKNPLPEFNGHILYLQYDAQELHYEINVNPASTSTEFTKLDRKIVYCYYTSGSTGTLQSNDSNDKVCLKGYVENTRVRSTVSFGCTSHTHFRWKMFVATKLT